MAPKLPADQASGDWANDEIAIEAWLHEKEAWQRDRAVQGNMIASVMRYTETGGDDVAKVKPTYTLVPSLADLDVFVDTELKRYERKFGTSKVAQADRVFIFYNVTGEKVLVSDEIEYDSASYQIVGLDIEVDSGRVEVLASLLKDS